MTPAPIPIPFSDTVCFFKNYVRHNQDMAVILFVQMAWLDMVNLFSFHKIFFDFFQNTSDQVSWFLLFEGHRLCVIPKCPTIFLLSWKKLRK